MLLGNLFNYFVLLVGIIAFMLALVFTKAYGDNDGLIPNNESIILFVAVCVTYVTVILSFYYSCNYGVLVDDCNLKTKLIRLLNSS